MLLLKNLLFQPLTLHLADSTKSVHLGPRGKETIRDKDLSKEINKAHLLGIIDVKPVESKDVTADGKK